MESHPGGSNTKLAHNSPTWARLAKLAGAIFFQSLTTGALPTLRAATDPEVLSDQCYGPAGRFDQVGYPKVVLSSDQSFRLHLPRRLWAVSEKLRELLQPGSYSSA
ncbi:Putative short-chain dehydrogenase/reductase [Mycobacteroides abscessus]|nr:Putative short-chain dehydrogenase/reductase [Mycobacteroides abscessus]